MMSPVLTGEVPSPRIHTEPLLASETLPLLSAATSSHKRTDSWLGNRQQLFLRCPVLAKSLAWSKWDQAGGARTVAIMIVPIILP